MGEGWVGVASPPAPRVPESTPPHGQLRRAPRTAPTPGIKGGLAHLPRPPPPPPRPAPPPPRPPRPPRPPPKATTAASRWRNKEAISREDPRSAKQANKRHPGEGRDPDPNTLINTGPRPSPG